MQLLKVTCLCNGLTYNTEKDAAATLLNWEYIAVAFVEDAKSVNIRGEERRPNLYMYVICVPVDYIIYL